MPAREAAKLAGRRSWVSAITRILPYGTMVQIRMAAPAIKVILILLLLLPMGLVIVQMIMRPPLLRPVLSAFPAINLI